jgi:hypothetical protein
MFVEKSRFPLLKRGAIENLPLAKGDLEGFFSAQHHFDETPGLIEGPLQL